MNEFKYQFVNFILLALLGTGIYWAFNTIDNGIVYDKDTTIAVIEQITEPVEEIVLFDNTKPEVTETTDEKPVEVETGTSSHKTLITQLQKLVDANVNINSGASGNNVGFVQDFLAVYFKDKDISIDKDFGPTTKGLVRDFQKAELNGGDGRVGPNTLKAMITWLKK